ncbi:MAG: hypothetical protein QOC83_2749 [Pseudonocardiales bacterium]|nr:hypothetical protein [Pseudonocardiales bacterium]
MTRTVAGPGDTVGPGPGRHTTWSAGRSLRTEIGWITAVASTSGSGPLPRPARVLGIESPGAGYDGPMSEPTNEDDQPTTDTSEPSEKSEPGVIGDEQLPEDLQPEKNPLARDPEEAADSDDDAAPGGDLPDAGAPGA